MRAPALPYLLSFIGRFAANYTVFSTYGSLNYSKNNTGMSFLWQIISFITLRVDRDQRMPLGMPPRRSQGHRINSAKSLA